MGTIIYPCGCKFKTLNRPDDEVIHYERMHEKLLDINGGDISIDVDIYNINMDCQATWRLFSRGETKGVFQLEGHLGKTWAKKVKPTCLEDLAALVALLRPGCLRALSGDPPKSMTQRYSDRKNKIEDVTYYHQGLQSILDKTYGVLVYQEQAMKISLVLAGFNEQEADVLRKAIGKKKPEIMAAIENDFINGCLKVDLVNKEQAEEIFGWIKESQRYSFNKCLSPTTVVETPNGFKILDEIKVGDKITSPEGETTIINKYDNGIQEVFEITLESGKTIQCTMKHRFLCSDGNKHSLEEILNNGLEIMCENGV